MIRLLEEKQQTQNLDRSDLAELLLTPLMSGKTEIADRIAKSVRMIQKEQETLGKEDQLRMESVLYAFAMKFLSKTELEDLKEVFEMTVLGQMLEDRGIEKGIQKGLEKGIRANIKTYKKLGASREDARDGIMPEFDLTADEAEKYILKYWEV